LSQGVRDSDSPPNGRLNLSPRARRGIEWMRDNRALFFMVLPVVLIALVPLYGILFPPLVDLPEHLLISKLLWEKLAGVSHLDLEFSFFLGYRLFPACMMIVLSLCKFLGISFLYLPRIVATALISFHAIVVVTILYLGLKDKSWRSCVLAGCFAIPAVVCMYSACWFIGFVNYTLAVTLLIPTVYLTERFLNSGKWLDAFLVFLTLLIVYTAHPFAPTFWLLWCFSRAFAGLATQSIVREWRRLLSLGFVFLPIFLYHFLATAGGELAPSSRSLLKQPAIVSIGDWYQQRFRGFLDGAFFRADNAADSRLFGLVAIGIILGAIVFAFCSLREQRAKNLALSSVFLIVGSSWINETFIPVPSGHWLAYDYRFSSTTYAIGLALAGMVLLRPLPSSSNTGLFRTVLIVLALFSAFASFVHLREVRMAYKRFDAPARKYVAKVFKHEEPVGIALPKNRYHPDGSYLKHYVCLTEPDCNSKGTTFSRGYAGALYPVRVRSADRVPTGPLVGYWKMDELKRGDACVDSSGNGNVGVPHGTEVVDGKNGRARSFNGSGDYVEIPAIKISDAITVAAWVYSDNFAQNGAIVTRNTTYAQWALFFERKGLLKWKGAGSGNDVACAAPSNHSWHHIVGSQKGAAGNLYVDGILCASANLPAIGSAPISISIGRFNTLGFRPFAGQIDEVRIYNRALSDSEISQLFTSDDASSLKASLR
jgi:hypothetical protein